MLVLSIRTDRPEAEVGLFDGKQQLAHETWQAHRELSITLHTKIDELLKGHGKTLHDLQGIACFKGPGSFTGLRIGLSVANALAYALNIPIVAAQGDDWLAEGLAVLRSGKNERVVLPEYGSPVHITEQKH
jgi:tRNA threonylcarbamoyladenosine biosynthesis protein TsaB